jgi:hypothetical protein
VLLSVASQRLLRLERLLEVAEKPSGRFRQADLVDV